MDGIRRSNWLTEGWHYHGAAMETLADWSAQERQTCGRNGENDLLMQRWYSRGSDPGTLLAKGTLRKLQHIGNAKNRTLEDNPD